MDIAIGDSCEGGRRGKSKPPAKAKAYRNRYAKPFKDFKHKVFFKNENQAKKK